MSCLLLHVAFHVSPSLPSMRCVGCVPRRITNCGYCRSDCRIQLSWKESGKARGGERGQTNGRPTLIPMKSAPLPALINEDTSVKHLLFIFQVFLKCQ